jgi:hypothetical protein
VFGTVPAPLSQLLAVSQSPPYELIQLTVLSMSRSSRCSQPIRSRRRHVLPVRKCRDVMAMGFSWLDIQGFGPPLSVHLHEALTM